MNEKLFLRAKHFQNTAFESTNNCAIAKAAKEQFDTPEVNVCSTFLYINNKTFYRIEYNYPQFNEDKELATSKRFSDAIVRELSLVRI